MPLRLKKSITDLFSLCSVINLKFALVVALLLACASAHSVEGMSQKVFELMQKVQQAAEEERFDDAHNLVGTLLKRRLNNHERAQVFNLQGNVFTLQKNYPEALVSFQNVAEIEDIPDGLRENALTVLVQLNMAEEKYTRAVDYSNQLMALKQSSGQPLGSNLLALRGQCFYALKQYPLAESSLRQAITLEQQLGNPPRENWLLLLNAVFFEAGNYPQMAEILQQLITYYPSDKYVYNLAAVYGQLDQQKEQLLLLEPLYEAGYLRNRAQRMLLAQLFMAEDVPFKAAKLLEQELNWQGLLGQDGRVAANALTAGESKTSVKDLEMLAQAWMLAKEPERALGPLTVAAQLSDTGNVYMRLAHSYAALADWPGVQEAALKAINKGELRDPGNAFILLGMAQYKSKHFAQAIDTFTKAATYDNVSNMGQQWQRYVEAQQEKRQLAGVEVSR